MFLQFGRPQMDRRVFQDPALALGKIKTGPQGSHFPSHGSFPVFLQERTQKAPQQDGIDGLHIPNALFGQEILELLQVVPIGPQRMLRIPAFQGSLFQIILNNLRDLVSHLFTKRYIFITGATKCP